MKMTFDLQHFALDTGAANTGENEAADAGQEEMTQQTEQQSQTDDRSEEYRRVREDYKKEFDDEIGKIIKGRLKKSGRENQQLNEQISAFEPVIKALSARYGIDETDLDALSSAVMNDGENAAAQTDEDEQFKEVFSRWAAESEATGELYPDFDFDREMTENNLFSDYISRGLDVTSAYELAHKDEIIMDAMSYALRMGERKIASSVAANTKREKENGLNAGEAAAVRVDIASLSNEQLDTYLARARQGERIDFVTRF